jgi:hypothetical protein
VPKDFLFFFVAKVKVKFVTKTLIRRGEMGKKGKAFPVPHARKWNKDSQTFYNIQLLS